MVVPTIPVVGGILHYLRIGHIGDLIICFPYDIFVIAHELSRSFVIKMRAIVEHVLLKIILWTESAALQVIETTVEIVLLTL